MGGVELACSVPTPTMDLSRLEGVVKGGGPSWGATMVAPSSCWKRGSPDRRPEEPTSVTKGRPELCAFYSVPAVWPEPAGRPQAYRPGLVLGNSRGWGPSCLFFSPPTTTTTVTPGPCHMETLFPNSTSWTELRLPGFPQLPSSGPSLAAQSSWLIWNL